MKTTLIIRIILLIILSIVSSIFVERKVINDEDFTIQSIIKWFFLIGVILISIGSLILLIINGSGVLINNLLLIESNIWGRSIFIGYCFVFTSSILLINSIVRSIKN